MEKIILSIMIFILLFSGCSFSSINSPSNTEDMKKETEQQEIIVNQKYSFGPAADLSIIDDKTKKELQEVLNKLGDVPKNTISFNGIEVRAQEDGAIVIDLFIRNGYSCEIYNIDSKLDIIVNEELVASGDFFFSKEEFGVLTSNMSRPWSIMYYPENIKNKEIKLENYIIKSTYQYEF
ncbi:SLAP domain-containing protein [Clostridium ganghwense]|uniref:SLAP domain-containing protein n=1 Tax=Clostridium ganghwense TaxID=312089 RepID=A0ABT4CP76_9CLOT|nr:SLAP domain-containing protein [Clostridium ganghwense]MCY6369779.1 SLAP domain-containing protein [Clostridium ganghwense]